MDPVLLGLLGTVVTGVLAYLMRENSRLKNENWQLLQALYENAEAMKNYAAMRKQGGPPA